MMNRSVNENCFDMMHRPETNVKELLETAELVGSDDLDKETIQTKLMNENSGVRYWACLALMSDDELQKDFIAELRLLLNDDSPSVQIIAAEILIKLNNDNNTLEVLSKYILDNERPWLALQAA